MTDQRVRKRVVIADDFPEMLEAVASSLAPDFEIVGKVSNGLALVQKVCELRPDLVVTDITMPGLSGIEALSRLREQGFMTPTVVLTVHDDEELARRALDLGAGGFVLKPRLAIDLMPAVREVLAGRTFISASLRKNTAANSNAAEAKKTGSSAVEVLLNQSNLLIARTDTMEWQPGEFHGCWHKPIFVEDSCTTSLIRMEAGTRYPAHRHGGLEEVFMIHGDLVVEGQKVKPGDYCRAEKGSVHSESYTESGCVFVLKASLVDETIG